MQRNGVPQHDCSKAVGYCCLSASNEQVHLVQNSKSNLGKEIHSIRATLIHLKDMQDSVSNHHSLQVTNKNQIT